MFKGMATDTGEDTETNMYTELFRRRNKSLSPISPGYEKPLPLVSTKGILFLKDKGAVIAACFVCIFLIEGFCKVCYAAEPFDLSELDMVFAYMRLQHGAEPWFDTENDVIISLHNPPIHLTLSTRYHDDNASNSDIEDVPIFPSQELCQVNQQEPIISTEDAVPNYQNVSGVTETWLEDDALNESRNDYQYYLCPNCTGFRNLQNRAIMSFEECPGRHDNSPEDSEIIQPNTWNNTIDGSVIQGNGLRKHDDAGGGTDALQFPESSLSPEDGDPLFPSVKEPDKSVGAQCSPDRNCVSVQLSVLIKFWLFVSSIQHIMLF